MKNAKKIIFGLIILLILALILLVFINNNKNKKNNFKNEDVKNTFLIEVSYAERVEIIKDILSKKYLVDTENSSVLIARELPGFINGVFINPNLSDGRGQIYFYAIFDKKIEIVWSGISDPDCSILKKYNFPSEMAVNCY